MGKGSTVQKIRQVIKEASNQCDSLRSVIHLGTESEWNSIKDSFPNVNVNMQTYDNMKRRNPVMNEALKLFMKDEIEEARLEEKKEMAINLSKEGMNVDFIARITNEAKDTIQKWLSIQLV